VSPTLTLLPDCKLLAIDRLRAHDDIIALDANVAPRTPARMSKPWVRVTQIAAPDYERAQIGHLTNFTMQFDCYAGDDAMNDYRGAEVASLLGRTVRAVVESWRSTTADDVATSSVHIVTDMDGLDTTVEPAHERRIIVADIRMHRV
jgi:hypothetical protein